MAHVYTKFLENRQTGSEVELGGVQHGDLKRLPAYFLARKKVTL
jgi:hypothetical protein